MSDPGLFGVLTEQTRDNRSEAMLLRGLILGASEDRHTAFKDCSSVVERCRTHLLASSDHVVAATSPLGTARVPPKGLHLIFAPKIGGDSAIAVWLTSRLVLDPRLEERAQLLVRLGEEFHDEDHLSVRAGLDEPLQAALTLIRAADRLLEFRYSLAELENSFDVPEFIGD